jgi:hypothetical protein
MNCYDGEVLELRYRDGKTGAEEYKASLISFLSSMQTLFENTEHPDLASVYGDVIYVIENF